MKKYLCLLVVCFALFINCKDEKDCCVFPEQQMVTLKFTHNWNGIAIANKDFNALKFTNQNEEKISIEKLRYLISNISFINFKNYKLIDVNENSENFITISDFTPGTYQLKFRFGFSDEDNIDGAYQDLNSVNFNVPGMLGGGYHYMQFDGKFLNTKNLESGFNYHTIRAVDNTDANNLKFEDTSFEVDLGTIEITSNTEIEIKMNVAEWFKNPNIWNLNELNTILMPNFEAQKMMSANGKSVFSLGEIN